MKSECCGAEIRYVRRTSRTDPKLYPKCAECGTWNCTQAELLEAYKQEHPGRWPVTGRHRADREPGGEEVVVYESDILDAADYIRELERERDDLKKINQILRNQIREYHK